MKSLLTLAVALAVSGSAMAQAGLYKSAEDFLNGNLEHQKSDFEKHKIRTDIPFNKFVVKVVDGGESHKYFKWDIYGYKNRRNEAFRFYNEKSYRIVDTSSFLLYAREENVVRGKEKTRETRYYFSKNADSRLIPLTIRNLKHAFPNREFHDLLDLQFSNNRELMKYDHYYGQYKLKSIFNKAMSLS